MLYDERKNTSSWSFYVVDDLAKMSNIYRFDSVGEALAKYKTLPTDRKSAIGASYESRFELDLIHRNTGNKPVLVMDSLRSANPVWQEPEIESARSFLLKKLKVQHQLDHTVFGQRYPSVAIPLDYNSGSKEEFSNNYFNDKVLRPFIKDPEKDAMLLSSIDEVFVEGEGWMPRDKFLDFLEGSRPAAIGESRRDVFVSKLNVGYINDYGNFGYMDVSPREFKYLRDKTRDMTLHSKVPGEKRPLSDLISDATAKKGETPQAPSRSSPVQENSR